MYVILEIIENFYNGAKEKVAELIDSIKEHIKSLVTGLLISVITEVIIAFFNLIGLLNHLLKNPYTTGLYYPIVLLNLIFALIIPALLIAEKFATLKDFEKLEEKFDVLNNIGNATSYSIGYFSVIASIYYIFPNYFPKYTYLFGITTGNIIVEVVFFVIAMLIILKLNSDF